MSEINASAPAPIEQSNVQPESSEQNESSIELSSSEGLESSDDSLQSDDAIDAAEAAGEISAKEANQLKKKLKLKVDGQEIEEEVDFNDEEGLKKHLQKSKAFDKRLKEFSTY